MRTYIALLLLVTSLGACESTKPSAPPPTPTAPTTPTTAQAPTTPDPWADTSPPKPKQPLPHPFFWRAEKDGKTTYFLGTIHTGIDAEVRLPDYVWKQLDDAPAFAMEMDLTKVDLDTKRTDGHTLHDDLGADYWAKLQAAITPGLAKALDDQKPMVAATLLQMKDLPKTPAMDGVLLGHAINHKKQLVYLEAAAKQQRLLEKYMDTKALKMELDHLAEDKAAIDALVAAYIAGDTDKMESLTEGERSEAKSSGYTDAEIDQQAEDMLYARNASWIEPLLAMHAQGNGFVAVGAAHLIGKKSVLALLAEKGFTITRIDGPASPATPPTTPK